ncbi:MAG: hypothetical protein QM704_14380 [Anaeromyxobacteraceae bacterium]
MRPLLLALLALPAAGCLPRLAFPQPVGVLFEDSAGPLACRGDVGAGTRDVRGEACRRGLAVPVPSATLSVAWGEGGYREALRKASEAANGAPLSDVQVDLHQTGILFWREECLVVTARTR